MLPVLLPELGSFLNGWKFLWVAALIHSHCFIQDLTPTIPDLRFPSSMSRYRG